MPSASRTSSCEGKKAFIWIPLHFISLWLYMPIVADSESNSSTARLPKFFIKIFIDLVHPIYKEVRPMFNSAIRPLRNDLHESPQSYHTVSHIAMSLHLSSTAKQNWQNIWNKTTHLYSLIHEDLATRCSVNAVTVTDDNLVSPGSISSQNYSDLSEFTANPSPKVMVAGFHLPSSRSERLWDIPYPSHQCMEQVIKIQLYEIRLPILDEHKLST